MGVSHQPQPGVMVQNNSLRKARVSFVTHRLQLFSNVSYLMLKEEHDGKVIIGDRNMTNLQLGNDIDTLAEKEQEALVELETLDKYGLCHLN